MNEQITCERALRLSLARKHAMMILVCAVCVMANLSPLCAQNRAGAGQTTSATIFCISSDGSGGAVFDPVVILNNGQFREAATGESMTIDQLRSEYYLVNRRYRLLFGGAEAGSVTVTSSEAGECLPTGALGRVQSSVRLGGNVTALATNENLGSLQSARRTPTVTERTAILSLVRAEFRRRGAPVSLLRNIAAENLAALDLDRDGRHEIVGSFAIKRARPFLVRQLFVIAEPQTGAGYRLALVRHEVLRAGNMMGEVSISDVGRNAFLTEMLIDSLDTNGDGTDEVFTRAMSFEGTHYAIYRREARVWRRAYEVYNYRCAY